MVDDKRIAEVVVCGPDADAHLEGIRRFADAGFDHVYVHQVGPDQVGFTDFYAREVLGEASGSSPVPRRRLRSTAAEHRGSSRPRLAFAPE